jgi:outer membrane immunogenic protein
MSQNPRIHRVSLYSKPISDRGAVVKKLVGSFIVATCFVTPALAADLPVRAQPQLVSPAYNWSGFYLGIEGGGGWGRARQTDPFPFSSGGYNVSGGLIGGTVGYNWQFNPWGLGSNPWVVGLEADYSYSNIKGSTIGTNPFFGTCGGAPPSCSSNLQSLGTFRGRIGLPWYNLLPYVTGGLAWGSLYGSEGDVLANGPVGSGTTTRVGGTIGVGIEAMLASSWTAKLEYLYVDLGRGGVFNDNLGGGFVLTESIDFRASILRAGINYKFN